MEKEVLCCCHNVTTDDVKKSIQEGITEFSDLQDKTGIGTECPPCTENSMKVFNKLLKAHMDK